MADANVCCMFHAHCGYATSTNPRADAHLEVSKRVCRNVSYLADAKVCSMFYTDCGLPPSENLRLGALFGKAGKGMQKRCRCDRHQRLLHVFCSLCDHPTSNNPRSRRCVWKGRQKCAGVSPMCFKPDVCFMLYGLWPPYISISTGRRCMWKRQEECVEMSHVSFMATLHQRIRKEALCLKDPGSVRRNVSDVPGANVWTPVTNPAGQSLGSTLATPNAT